jgi:hypothetical protein
MKRQEYVRNHNRAAEFSATCLKSQRLILEEVSTTCGNGWVGELLRSLVANGPTRYRRWY